VEGFEHPPVFQKPLSRVIFREEKMLMFSTLSRARGALALVVSAGFATLGLSQVARNISRSSKCRTAARRGGIPNFERLENRQLMSTYYVSPGGSDSNSGTSPSSPWQSIHKVNSVDLNAGDSVLFQGGQTFYGSLSIGSRDSGTSTTPVTFGSYNGQATINSTGGDGAVVSSASGIWFENLKFVGSPNSSFQQTGITFTGYSGSTYYTNDRIDNCDISGYYFAGVLALAAYSSGGLSGLSITNNSIHDNVDAGIETYSSYPTGIVNMYVGYNQVYNNYGDGHTQATGNGIELGGVSNALVEHNSAYLNGSIGGMGGVGIWAYNANDVTFQYNASYDNKTTKNNDGDGFDFDADVSNSVMQYNYSYGNDGTGFQFDQWKNDSDFTNDIIRYNVAVNNGRKNNYGNIELWGKVLNAYVYNNVIYTTPGNSGTNAGIQVRNNTLPGLHVSNVHFVNNIIDTTGGARLINVTSSELNGASNLTFTGNIYWTNGASVNIVYGSDHNSLASFEATGQEQLNGRAYGIFADPLFVNSNGATAAPAASTDGLAGAAAGFKLLAGSPAYSQSLSVTSLFGISTGGTDFFGDPIASDAATVAGAYQAQAASAQNTVSPVPSGSSTKGVASLTGYDIGAPPLSGSNSASNGVYTVTASGAVILFTADQFRFVETSLTGDGTIIAQVDSLTDTNIWAKAGVMIRSSLAPNASEVSTLVSPNQEDSLEVRSTIGGSTSPTDESSTDKWVKLVRSGNTFTGYISANGTSWSEVTSVTVDMGSTVDIGLAVCSQNNNARATAVFSNVSIT
jgi:regulation of enolase protein 1 (concanavalin A-like superfamily)